MVLFLSSSLITTLPISLIPKSPTSSNPVAIFVTVTAIVRAIFFTLSSADAKPTFASQQIIVIVEGENRLIALLLPLVPTIVWVLYNIFQPTVNQINRMRSKGLIVRLGIGGGFAVSSGFFTTSDAAVAEATASNDITGQLLLFVVAPTILWVLYNTLQPALNRSTRCDLD